MTVAKGSVGHSTYSVDVASCRADVTLISVSGTQREDRGQGPPEINDGPGGPGPPRGDQNLNEDISLKAVDLRQLRIYNDNLVLLQD